MSNHTPVAPATNENSLNEAPVYQSLADYAKDGLYLLEELNEISGVLRLLTETCHERYEDELDLLSKLFRSKTQWLLLR